MKLFSKVFVIISLGFILGFSPQTNEEPYVIKNGDLIYSSNEIIIKFKYSVNFQNDRIRNVSTLLKVFSEVNIKSIDPFINSVQHDLLKSQHGIDRIYSIKYEGNLDPLILARKISNSPDIEYAEPRYIYKIDFTPNDPFISNQTYLTRVNLFNAWDVSRGDTTVVIGIIDTGVYWNHPDLTSNIWINHREIPNNNIDDDGNGYVDDYRGWDFGGLNGSPDNDPREDNPYHGTHVAGIASAVTNNGLGVAGAGFRCKVMAVKAAREDKKDPNSGSPYIWYGYEGIVYAADNRAQIINCSWGGSAFSALAQDVINYATSKGTLVIAAAGNSNTSSEYYPAAYKNVLAVAATNSTNDIKASFSNYGYYIDVSAPGTSLLNTWSNDNYASLSGTSMASPLVAGIAGLVKARYPNYTPEQVGEKVRVSCDDIYSVNTSYRFQLGKGRVNAWRALQDSINKSIRMLSYVIDDSSPLGNGNGILEPNEQANIKVSFKNIIASTTNLVITCSSATSGISVINNTFNAGSKTSGETFNNFSNPFRIQASGSIGTDVNTILILNFSDSNYSDFQVINFTTNPSYTVTSNNNVRLTVGSAGNFAFNNYPTNTIGEGFKYKTSDNLLFEGALIIGTSATRISDRARNNTGNAQNQDFTVVTPVRSFQPGQVADLQIQSVFNDNGAGATRLGVKVILDVYSYASDPFRDFVILHYKFINTSTTQLTNFHAGLFFDWDLIATTGLDDIARWDNVNKFGYVFNQPQTVPYYVGSALLSHNNHHYRAILNAGGDGGWGIYDGFSDSEKWEAISGGLTKTQAGAGDVSYVIASGPFTINPNDTLSVAFAIIAGDNLLALTQNVLSAKLKWQQILTEVRSDSREIPSHFSLSQNYPNPFNPTTKIEFALPEDAYVQLEIFNIAGEKIISLISQELKAGYHSVTWNGLSEKNESVPSGIYFYKIKVNGFSDKRFIQTRKMVYIK